MDIPSLFMIPSAVSLGKVHSVFPNSTDADFDFNRDSDATRVNSEGLIERVGYYGSELITNGSFDTDTNWVKAPSGVTISGGSANFNSASDTYVYQDILTASKTYRIIFSAIINSGSFYIGENGAATNIYTAGTYTNEVAYFTVSSSARFIIRKTGAGTLDATIHNVSVKEVTGDRARLNYEIEGGLVNTKPSLLLEPQSTNLIKYSNDYTQSEWNKISGATVDANVAISPDGTLNASRLNFNTVVGSRMEDQIASASSGNYSFAVYLKADEPKTVGIRTGFAGTATVNVNVTTEWQRFSITQNNPTNPANGYAQIRSIDASGGSVYVWGAQIEQLSYSTSLIPTNGSTQTRAAETCNGAGTSSILPSEEGILYAEIAALADDNTYRILSISDGTTNERVYMQYTNVSNKVAVVVKDGGVTQANMVYVLSDRTNFSKVAIKWKANDFALWVDGSERATDTSGTVPSGMDTVAFDAGNGNSDFYGKVRDIRVYNTKEMTDSEVDILLTKITS